MNLSHHHVAITVNNLDESIAWYKSKLGFALIKRYDKEDAHIALVSLGNCIVELFQFDQTKPLPEYRKELMNDLRTVGAKHFCLQTDNLDRAIEELTGKGVKFTMKPDTSFYGSRFTFFKDCNGILIELSQQ